MKRTAGSAVAIGLVVLLIGIAIFASLLGGGRSDGTTSTGSPDSHTGDGTWAWAELLRRNGRSVGLRRTAFDDGALPDRGTFVVVSPDGVTTGELHALDRWLDRPSRRAVVLDPDDRLLHLLPGGPKRHRGATSDTVEAAAPAPETAGVHVVEAYDGGWLSPGDGLPLYRYTDGSRHVFGVRYTRPGGGELVVLADAAPLTNDLITEEDDAGLGLALARPGDGPVTFDLYHHLPHQVNGVFAWLPGRWQRALWQLLLAGVVLSLAAGVRFGPPVPAPEVEPRRRAEFVEAMGAALARSKGHTIAAGVVQDDLRERLRRFLGTGPTVDDRTLADAAEHAGLDRALVGAALASGVDSGDSLIAASAASTRIRHDLDASAGRKTVRSNVRTNV